MNLSARMLRLGFVSGRSDFRLALSSCTRIYFLYSVMTCNINNNFATAVFTNRDLVTVVRTQFQKRNFSWGKFAAV